MHTLHSFHQLQLPCLRLWLVHLLISAHDAVYSEKQWVGLKLSIQMKMGTPLSFMLARASSIMKVYIRQLKVNIRHLDINIRHLDINIRHTCLVYDESG